MDGGLSIDLVVIGNIASTWRGNQADRYAVPFGAWGCKALQCREATACIENYRKK